MFAKSVLALFAVASMSARQALAQNYTREQISDCGGTIFPVNVPGTYYFDVNDETVYDVSYTYDPSICTSNIPVTYLRLTNEVTSTIESCTYQQFDGSGMLYGRCKSTRGKLARDSRDQGYNDYSLDLTFGVRPEVRSSLTYFYIEPQAASPEPSGGMSKKRRDTQHIFDCPIGHTYCWTGQGQDYACMDTSSDVSACGQCPFAFGTDIADCTSIEGVDDVECRNSRCVVNACQRGFQISLDRTKCVDARKRSQPVRRGVLF